MTIDVYWIAVAFNLIAGAFNVWNIIRVRKIRQTLDCTMIELENDCKTVMKINNDLKNEILAFKFVKAFFLHNKE